MKDLIKMGKEYLKEIEKKMKSSGTATKKLTYKPKPIKKKKQSLVVHKLKRITSKKK